MRISKWLALIGLCVTLGVIAQAQQKALAPAKEDPIPDKVQNSILRDLLTIQQASSIVQSQQSIIQNANKEILSLAYTALKESGKADASECIWPPQTPVLVCGKYSVNILTGAVTESQPADTKKPK